MKFRVGNTNMLVSKNAKICLTLKANFKICVTSRETRTCSGIKVVLGLKHKIPVMAMYISFFFVDFIRIGSRFSVEYGLMHFVSPVFFSHVFTPVFNLFERFHSCF